MSFIAAAEVKTDVYTVVMDREKEKTLIEGIGDFLQNFEAEVTSDHSDYHCAGTALKPSKRMVKVKLLPAMSRGVVGVPQ